MHIKQSAACHNPLRTVPTSPAHSPARAAQRVMLSSDYHSLPAAEEGGVQSQCVCREAQVRRAIGGGRRG